MAKKRFVGGSELARRQPEDAVSLVGPVQIVGDDVPVPIADVGDALRLGQPGFARAQGALGLFALRDIAPTRSAVQDLAVLVANGRDVQTDVDRRSVARSQLQLGIVYLACLDERLKRSFRIFHTIRVIQVEYGPADDLTLGVAQSRGDRLVALDDRCGARIDRYVHVGSLIIEIAVPGL